MTCAVRKDRGNPLASGANLVVIAKTLGHTSFASTAI